MKNGASDERLRGTPSHDLANAPASAEHDSADDQQAIDLAVGAWVRWHVQEAERSFGSAPVEAYLSAHRLSGMEFMTCDLVGQAGSVHPITIAVSGELELCPGDPSVVDAVSAVQLIGKLLSVWSLRTSVGG